MSEHTKRILERMIALLNEYQQGVVSLRYLVDGLEGSLNTLEEKLPETFYTQWYIHWGGLEQILAAGTREKRHAVVLEDVESLKALLLQFTGES